MAEIVELSLELRVRGETVDVSGSFTDARGDKTGTGVESLPLPATPDALDRYLADDPDTLGPRLAAALFRGEVRERFLEGRRWVRSAESEGERRLFVRLSTQKESLWLQRLPWEEVLEPDVHRPLGLAPDVTLVRDVVRLAPGRRCSPPADAPRLLVVVGAPELGAALDVAGEVEALDRLADHGWRVDVVESGRLDEVRACFAQARADGTPYDVLHFIGHGRLGRGEGELKLLAGDDDREAWVPGSLLWQQMGRHPPPLLVVLAACDTAGTSAESPLAPALAFLENGVSSVLAMAHPVPDTAAVAFATAFYPELADTRDPARALHTARLKVQSRHPEDRSWATPVALGSWRPWTQSAAARRRSWKATAAGLALASSVALGAIWSHVDEPRGRSTHPLGFAAATDPGATARAAKERLAGREAVDRVLDDPRSWSFELLGCGWAAKTPAPVLCVVRVENLRDIDRTFTVFLEDSRLLPLDGAVHPATFLLLPGGEVMQGEGRAPLLLAPETPATLVLGMQGVPEGTTTADLVVKYFGGSRTFPAVALEPHPPAAADSRSKEMDRDSAANSNS